MRVASVVCVFVTSILIGAAGAAAQGQMIAVAFNDLQQADVGAMPAHKTRVLRFDLGNGVKCGDVSRLLLEDITACKGGDMDPANCLAAVALSSRAGVPFDF